MRGRHLLIFGRRVKVQLVRGGELTGIVQRVEADEVLLDIGGYPSLLRAAQIAEVSEPATWERREEVQRQRPPGTRRGGALDTLVGQAPELIVDGLSPRRRGLLPRLSHGNQPGGGL